VKATKQKASQAEKTVGGDFSCQQTSPHIWSLVVRMVSVKALPKSKMDGLTPYFADVY
jgi:hypothetical protein